jgi:NAD(P)-dependent dehydrogenase (short-subunit alcohol dehydrogenase family)
MLDGRGDEAAAHQPIPRLGEPDEIAQAVLYLSGDSSAYVTGSHLVVDGGAVLGRG